MSSSIWEAHLELVRYSYTPARIAFSYPVETYPDWMMLILTEGRFAYKVGGGRNALAGECHVGDWVLVPPGDPFHREMLEPCAFHYCRFRLIGEGLEAWRGGHSIRDSARLRSNLAILRDSVRTDITSQWRAHLLMDLLRAAAWERQTAGAAKLVDAAMDRTREYLETRWADPISLAHLAAEMRLTPAAFSRRFKAAVGQAPMEFLLDKRCDEARRLLLGTELTVDVIGRRCGFTNGFYFSRLWRKRYGGPPGKFRREHRV